MFSSFTSPDLICIFGPFILSIGNSSSDLSASHQRCEKRKRWGDGGERWKQAFKLIGHPYLWVVNFKQCQWNMMFNCIINSCLIKLVNRWLLYFMTSDVKVLMFYILGLLLMRLTTCSNVIKDIGYGQMFAHSSHQHEYPGNLGLLIIFLNCSFFKV